MPGQIRKNPAPRSQAARKPRAASGEKTDQPAERTPTFTKRVKKKFRLFSIRSGLDMPFLFLVMILLVIGLVMLFSSSYAYAYYNYDDSYYFIIRQAIFAVLGITVMLLISYFDYHHLHKLAIPLLLASYFMLVVVLFLPAVKGVHRWIDLGPFGFQPSEIAKFAMTLCFAHLISINFKRMDTARYGVLPYVILLGITVVLLIRELTFRLRLLLLHWQA